MSPKAQLFKDGAPGDPAVLVGRKCVACGRVHFPPQDYGCEGCGAHGDDFPEVEIGGAGRIKGVAALHRHDLAGVPKPAYIAEIELDDGPALEAILDADDGAGMTAGDRVSAVLVEADGKIDLRFRPA
ncbi:MAG: zinc ribbon domain-containing protein [Alphaproteobacteria bacterium]